MSHVIWLLRHFGSFGDAPCTYSYYYEDEELAVKNRDRLARKYGKENFEILPVEVLGWDIYDKKEEEDGSE